jgi:hypothetical protein
MFPHRLFVGQMAMKYVVKVCEEQIRNSPESIGLSDSQIKMSAKISAMRNLQIIAKIADDITDKMGNAKFAIPIMFWAIIIRLIIFIAS